MLGLLHFGLPGANQPQPNPHTDKAIDPVIAAGKIQRDAGRPLAAIHEFNRALELAQARHDTERQARCLVLIAASRVRLFQYRAGLRSAQEAAKLALQVKNFTLAGAAMVNIATIYDQLADFPSAESAAARAVELLRRAPKEDPLATQFLVKAYLSRAWLCFAQGKNSEGEKWADSGRSLANKIGNSTLEATAWETLGTALLRENDVPRAGDALNKEYRLRQALHDEDGLAITKEHFAELELKKAHPDYSLALKTIDEAFSATSSAFKGNAQYYPIHIRAKILLGCGKKAEAIAEFRRAVNAANSWREGALPGDATATQTVAALHDVYHDFAQLAASISLATHDPALSREAFSVLAENRAASLREQLAVAFGRNLRLPDTYFAKLSELQNAQARVTLGENSPEDKANLTRIRVDLSDIENEIGLEDGKNYLDRENFLRKNSLRNIQSRLKDDQLLLSFSLGTDQSFLWVVKGKQVDLYQLASESIVGAQASSFTHAIRDGKDATQPGRLLSRNLFGSLPAADLDRPEWLIVADGSLLGGVPLAALPDPAAPAVKECCDRALIDRHALRFLPSELLLLDQQMPQPSLRFVGIGDPVYNFADSRLAAGTPPADAKTTSGVALARLVGSEREVQSAARLSGLHYQEILLGPRANSTELQKSLAGGPEVIHFAVHVVSPPERPEEAALALSLKNGIPELLTPEAIAALRVPGSLVVLSGCSSGQGKALPSAGLQGLSRAWLLAGAAAVIVSSWPTPDDSGRFFSAFYGHLQAVDAGPLAQRAARALQQTQLDMRQSKGKSGAPSFWAAYSLISKE